MTRKITVKAVRESLYEIEVPDDYDPDADDAFSDKVYAALETDEVTGGETVSINAYDGYKQVY